jgi:tetratricopeptide (TPR) repeat protein
MERYQEAYDAFAKAVAMSPEQAEYWGAWAQALRKDEKFDESIVKCRKVLELDPGSAGAYQIWGVCLEHHGKKQEALEKYRKAVELKPGYEYPEFRIRKIESELASQSGQ